MPWGFWAALDEAWPQRCQRCWVHKTANVLYELPKSIQGKAKAGLHEIWMAETKARAEKALDRFVRDFGAKYPKAVDCLVKDRVALPTRRGQRNPVSGENSGSRATG